MAVMEAGRPGFVAALQLPTNSKHMNTLFMQVYCNSCVTFHRFVSACGHSDEPRPAQAQGEASAIRALIETVKKEEVSPHFPDRQ